MVDEVTPPLSELSSVLCVGIVYEPVLEEEKFFNSRVVKNLEEFKDMCDVIVSNRLSCELEDVKEKVYTRDLFGKD